MIPYYNQGGITIYNADFRDVLNEISIEADVIIADPPYGETSLQWDTWPRGWPNVMSHHLSPAGSMWCFGSMRMFLDRVSDFGSQKPVEARERIVALLGDLPRVELFARERAPGWDAIGNELGTLLTPKEL